MKTKLSKGDRAEIAQYKRFLKARDQWDIKNAAITSLADDYELDQARWNRLRFQAHIEIYQDIYGT